MSTEEASYRPINVLDKMEGKNHIVLLYYNEKKVCRSGDRSVSFKWFAKRRVLHFLYF